MYHGNDYRLHMDNRLMITYTHNAVHPKNYALFERRVRKLIKRYKAKLLSKASNSTKIDQDQLAPENVFEASGLVTDHTAAQSGTSYNLHGFADLFVGKVLHEFKYARPMNFDALPGQGATYYKLRNADMDADEIREHKDMHIVKDCMPGRTAREWTRYTRPIVSDDDEDQGFITHTYLANPLMVLDLRKDSTLEELDEEYPFQEYEEEEEQKPLDRLLVF